MNKPKPTIIEYVGPAGVGKTTLANKKIKELEKKKIGVVGGDIYKKNKMLFYFHALQFPFFIIRKISYCRYIWCLFKEKTLLRTKIKRGTNLLFFYFKLEKLANCSRKNNIQYIFSDHGIFQELGSLHYQELIELKKINKKKILSKLYGMYEIKLLKEKSEVIVKRRLQRRDSNDNYSQKEMELQSEKGLMKISEVVKKVSKK